MVGDTVVGDPVVGDTVVGDTVVGDIVVENASWKDYILLLSHLLY